MNNKGLTIGLIIALAINLILSTVIIVMLNSNSKDISMVKRNQIDQSDKIEVKSEEIDYDKIENMIENQREEDFDKMEKVLEEKYEEMDKDFGEKFEEMTSYFKGKTKESLENFKENVK